MNYGMPDGDTILFLIVMAVIGILASAFGILALIYWFANHLSWI